MKRIRRSILAQQITKIFGGLFSVTSGSNRQDLNPDFESKCNPNPQCNSSIMTV